MKSILNSYSKEELQAIVNDSINITEALQKAGYVYTSGTNHELFKKVCKEKNVDYSHFVGQKRKSIVRTEENVFCKNSTAAQSTLRSWYLKGNYSEYKCAICGISEWNGKELTLRLDHINGHNKDNRLENLRWVCPNCDSQLKTFCRGHQGLSQKQQIYTCPNCGKPISRGAKLCKECAAKEKQKTDRPNREKLKELIRTTSFTEIGNNYNVSDNAIRKWCDRYNLPRTKKIINSYSDEQWALI